MDLCGCGIPYIILEGTAEDYKKLYQKQNNYLNMFLIGILIE